MHFLSYIVLLEKMKCKGLCSDYDHYFRIYSQNQVNNFEDFNIVVLILPTWKWSSVFLVPNFDKFTIIIYTYIHKNDDFCQEFRKKILKSCVWRSGFHDDPGPDSWLGTKKNYGNLTAPTHYSEIRIPEWGKKWAKSNTLKEQLFLKVN